MMLSGVPSGGGEGGLQRGVPAGGALCVQQMQVQALSDESYDCFCFTFYFSCCSNCTATCINCPLRQKLDPNQLVNAILGLGGENFK